MDQPSSAGKCVTQANRAYSSESVFLLAPITFWHVKVIHQHAMEAQWLETCQPQAIDSTQAVKNGDPCRIAAYVGYVTQVAAPKERCAECYKAAAR